MISPGLSKEINSWIETAASSETPNTPETRRSGLALSDKLLDELTKLGLLQLFEEQVSPPFMLDFDLEERKERMSQADREKAEKIDLEGVQPPSDTKKKRCK